MAVADGTQQWMEVTGMTEDGTEVDVVGTLKGGVGKTKLAMMMALYCAVKLDRTVELIDGDTVSQTANEWMRDAVAAGLEWPANLTVVRHPFDDIDQYIESRRGKVRHVIADIGGGNPAVLEAALTQANRFYAPVGADPSETRKLQATWNCAKRAALESKVAGGFTGFVVLSKTDHRKALPRQAREQLTDHYPLCDTEMRERVGYQRAYANVPSDFLDVPALLLEVGMITEQQMKEAAA